VGPNLWPTFGSRYSRLSTLSTAYHPQTDGLTERWNQEIKKYLQFYIKNEIDWASLLPFAVAAYNNRVNKSLGYSPFYALFGYHPNTEFAISPSMSNLSAENYLEHLAAIRERARDSLDSSKDKQKQRIDPQRQQASFKVGQQVLLSTKNLTPTGTRKFQRRWIGPFQIIGKINDNAYRLQIPSTWRHHSVFNVTSRL
jgi:ribosomal protein L21E